MFEYFKKLLKTKCDEIETKTKELEQDIDDVAEKLRLIKTDDKISILRNELERLIEQFAIVQYQHGSFSGFSGLQEDTGRQSTKYREEIKDCINDLYDSINEQKLNK